MEERQGRHFFTNLFTTPFHLSTNSLIQFTTPFHLFYTNAGKSAADAILHMRGVDFTQSVRVVPLEAGTILQQYVKWGRGPGNYFLRPGTNPLSAGIGDAVTRNAVLFKSAESTSALQSTASNFLYPDQMVVPWTGGATQWYRNSPGRSARQVKVVVWPGATKEASPPPPGPVAP